MHSRISKTRSINYTFRSERSPSIATLENPTTEESSDFTFKQLLADKETFKVRKFSDELTGEMIVIKSPAKSIRRSLFEKESKFYDAINTKIREVQRELKYMRQAYPDDAPYAFETDTHHDTHDIIWSYRLIMPNISGHTLFEYAARPHRNTTWLLFFVAIAKEIQKIHQRDIIHGDVHSGNALVYLGAEEDNHQIHFIDFECAYSIYEEEAVVTEDTGERALHWAPERKGIPSNRPGPGPGVKQDVYSYGCMVRGFMRRGAPGFIKKYPEFSSSIEATMNEDPELRPDLEQIISQAKCSL